MVIFPQALQPLLLLCILRPVRMPRIISFLLKHISLHPRPHYPSALRRMYWHTLVIFWHLNSPGLRLCPWSHLSSSPSRLRRLFYVLINNKCGQRFSSDIDAKSQAYARGSFQSTNSDRTPRRRRSEAMKRQKCDIPNKSHSMNDYLQKIFRILDANNKLPARVHRP